MIRLEGLGTEGIGRRGPSREFKIRDERRERNKLLLKLGLEFYWEGDWLVVPRTLTRKQHNEILFASDDNNPLHCDWRVAQELVRGLYGEELLGLILEMDRKFVIFPGMGLLSQLVPIGLTGYLPPQSLSLIPVKISVKFSVPLVIRKEQKVLYKFRKLDQEGYFYDFKVEYGQPGYRKLFQKKEEEKKEEEDIIQPIMHSREPLTFTTPTEKASGINEEVKKEFAEVLNRGGEEILVDRFKAERKLKNFFKSINLLEGKEQDYGLSMFIATQTSRLSSDLASYEKKEEQTAFLYWTMKFFLNPFISYQPGEEVEMRIFLRERSRVIDMDVAFLLEKEGRKEPIVLERIRIAKKEIKIKGEENGKRFRARAIYSKMS